MSAVLQRQKPHASAAATALRDATIKPYETLKDVVGGVARAVIRLRSVDDLIEVMEATNALSLAAEALSASAEALSASADAALVASMTDTGCTGFATAHHNVSLRTNAGSVDIPDESAVPPAFLMQPPPRPDKAKIRAALKNGDKINWATLKESGVGLQRRPT